MNQNEKQKEEVAADEAATKSKDRHTNFFFFQQR